MTLHKHSRLAFDPTPGAALPGIDLSFVDQAVRPQDDLFGHVNGVWLRDHVIPDDRSSDGSFYSLRDVAEADVREIIEAAAADAAGDPDAQRIGDLYTSFLDTDRLEALGFTPVQEEIDAIAEAESPVHLAAVIGQLQRAGVSGLFGYYVDTDAKQSDRYLVQLTQSGLSLPDEAYYREEQHAPIREKFVEHVTAMLRLAGFLDAAERANTILELETKIAAGHWDVVARRDADKTYNLHTFDELVASAPGFDFSVWAIALANSVDAVAEVNVMQPSFFAHAAELFATEPLFAWRTWAQWQVVKSRASYLSDAFVSQNFSFYGTALTGAPAIRERWKRATASVEQNLGFAVGKIYTREHFPPEAKQQMEGLVANLIEAYRQSITSLDWMTPDTRQRALAKLDTFNPKIGYPSAERDYRALLIDPTDLVGNIRRSNVFEHDREFAKIGQPVDRDEWFMTPQTVNAYYNPGMNEIVFPAAILQPPFFSPDSDDAVNYGAIGAVIGHEIGHGFDDQGAKYDGLGNLNDWWTDADRDEFGARTKALIAQYDTFTPRGLDPSHTVNGAFTIGENIGDLGGLSIALKAYRIAIGDSEPAPIDGLSGIERVFYSWAQVWRGKSRTEEAIRRLAIDPHSPADARCNCVVRNIPEFYDAFSVTESDELYLASDERVRIW